MLEKSENLLNQHPDSALYWIESIDFPEDMNNEHYAQYCKLLVMSHIKNRIDIKSDTIIHHAVDYYKNLPEERLNYGKSLLLLGNVYEEQENLALAEKYYFEVYSLSKNIKDSYLLQESAFELGGLHVDLLEYKEAIIWFDIAKDAAIKNNDRIMKHRSMRYAADCYALLGMTDTALTIYDKVLSEIPQEKRFARAEIYKNIAIVYKNTKQYKESINYIQKSINTLNREYAFPLQYILLSSIYESMGNRDSSNYYIKMALIYAKEQGSLNNIHKIYESSLDTNFPEKFDNYLLTNSFSSSTFLKLKHTTVKYQHLYNVEKIKKRNKELTIERQRYLSLSVIALIVLIAGFLYYQSIKKRKSIEFNNELKDKDIIINSIRHALYQRLEIYIKMIRLSISPNKAKHKDFLSEYSKIIFERDDQFAVDWDLLIELTNNVFGNFYNEIGKQFSDLIETDTKIIMLLKLGFSVSEIALIFDKSIHTIYRYSSNIRKKLNIPEEESITDFFDRNMIL